MPWPYHCYLEDSEYLLLVRRLSHEPICRMIEYTFHNANVCDFVAAPASKPKKAVTSKALKPDVFQDFKLSEKTVLSHNTAM